MDSIEIQNRVTFLAGRPSSGKTTTAIATSKDLLQKNWNIIYYHAEGDIHAQRSSYGASVPEHLLQLQLITDLHFSIEDLRQRILRPYEGICPTGTLVIIDILDLYDCTPDDFFLFIDEFRHRKDLHFLLLCQLPKYLEKRTRDHAEVYVRNYYNTHIDHQIVIVGRFPDEI